MVRTRRWMVVLVAAIAITATFAAAQYVFAPGPSPPVFPTVNGTLSVNTSVRYTVPSSFLGVNLRADFAIGPQGLAVSATPARMVRWPGGALADRLDPMALGGQGLIYGGGSPYPSPSSAANFVTWCESVGCRAILTLPGEIDNPSYAVQEVRFFEDTLHFDPAYWEIGNEPALWTHWGYAWTDWTAGQNSTPDAVQYADQVAKYITAIRTVDTATPILGLPGTGTGASGEVGWIEATVAVNGPNLTAIAIHLYPAGAYTPGVSPGELFSSLGGPDGLPSRVAADLSAIHFACSSCQISILVDEVGVESSATYQPVTFSWVPYEAVELIQAIESNVGAMVYWVSQGSYPGSWLTGSGSDGLTYGLFHAMPMSFASGAWEVGAASVATGVYGLLLGSIPSDPAMVLLVNTNVSDAVRVNLSTVVPPGLSGSVVTWSNTSATPESHSWGGSAPIDWVLPPDSLLWWESSSPP